MKYLLLLIFIPAARAFSYARYIWKEGNKAGCAGVTAITAASVALSFYYVFFS